ncbi:hypothetical protein GPECTOR_99g825 [Gonium pectorale]|uniref:Uncharacterized protein n=1 Tax=Gonium pectorale TaxID=33097 RepID=A0A150G1M3_GONPE|nr:hypothetical protein GPECTOR_99g825 [Gonium pectorale]|eukprot:KXZ43190.1 hypothetical protein GPECTOR_99g825 [Gonium pectorale]
MRAGSHTRLSNESRNLSPGASGYGEDGTGASWAAPGPGPGPHGTGAGAGRQSDTAAAASAFARVSGGTAVHPWDLEVEDPDSGPTGLSGGGGAGGSGAGGGRGDELGVQHSARSDTAAMTWDRRSVRAERELLEVEERGHGAAASFTAGRRGAAAAAASRTRCWARCTRSRESGGRTEQRLRARRAPLEGDESLDTMMEDAELERRVSVASLPSSCCRASTAEGPAAAAAPTAAPRPPLSRLPEPALLPSAATVLNSAGGAAATGAVLALLTPHSSVLGAPPGDSPSARQSLATRRQLSRLFVMSVADGEGGGGSGSRAAPGSDAASEVADGTDAQLDLAAAVVAAAALPTNPGLLQQLQAQRRQQQKPLHGYAGAGAAPPPSMELLPAPPAQGAAGDGPGTGPRESLPPAAAAALESPLACGSPLLSPAASLLERRRGGGGRASGAAAAALNSASSWLGHGGASSSMLRSLLKQHVSIADSMDLDAVGAAAGSPPAWQQRRPGRFEVAGSESSSFLFGDDRERYEMLQLLREEGGEGDGEDGDADGNGEGAAAGSPGSARRGGGGGAADEPLRMVDHSGVLVPLASVGGDGDGGGDREGAEGRTSFGRGQPHPAAEASQGGGMDPPSSQLLLITCDDPYQPGEGAPTSTLSGDDPAGGGPGRGAGGLADC